MPIQLKDAWCTLYSDVPRTPLQIECVNLKRNVGLRDLDNKKFGNAPVNKT